LSNRHLVALVVAMMGFALSASAAKPVYRCKQDGQTILTDRPCDRPPTEEAAESSASSSTAGGTTASALPTVVGDWRGETQFQASTNGARVAEAQSVAPLVLTLSPDGKVVGSSPDNACNVLGIWSPGSTPRLFMLDVSLNNCRYAKFNQRYSGTLIATFPERMAQLSLIANTLPIPGQPLWRFDLGATLRR
jgi:hypothetical protein